MYDKAHFTHLPVVEEVAGPRDICQVVLTAIFPRVSCNSSSSVFLNHYRALCTNKDVDPKRLGSENNAMKEAQGAHTNDTAGIVAAALAVASYIFIFHETLVLRLSEICPIPWFLTEGEVEILVDPSTCHDERTYIKLNQGRTIGIVCQV